MKLRQKQERRQIEDYDRQSQARRDALLSGFDREKQVLLSLHTVSQPSCVVQTHSWLLEDIVAAMLYCLHADIS